MSNTHISSQAFLEDPNKPGKFTEALDPVCSTNIFDAKVSKTVDLKLSLNFRFISKCVLQAQIFKTFSAVFRYLVLFACTAQAS